MDIVILPAFYFDGDDLPILFDQKVQLTENGDGTLTWVITMNHMPVTITYNVQVFDTSYTAPQNALHTLSFEYAGGHVYGVETTLSLTNPEWALQKVKKTETDAEHEQVMPSADEDDVGVATIFVVPVEGAKSQFFKVEAK